MGNLNYLLKNPFLLDMHCLVMIKFFGHPPGRFEKLSPFESSEITRM